MSFLLSTVPIEAYAAHFANTRTGQGWFQDQAEAQRQQMGGDASCAQHGQETQQAGFELQGLNPLDVKYLYIKDKVGMYM